MFKKLWNWLNPPSPLETIMNLLKPGQKLTVELSRDFTIFALVEDSNRFSKNILVATADNDLDAVDENFQELFQ